MAEHNSIYGRDIIQGVLMKMSSCISELLSQGNPIKIDGLGTFVPTVESTKEGITRAALLEGKWNANTYVKGIHIRFKPEGSAEDKITSVARSIRLRASFYIQNEIVDNRTHKMGKALPLSCDWT